MFQPVPARQLGMIVLVGLLVLLTAAPSIALLTARIRPPHFGSITGRDLFRRIDGMPIDAVAPVEHESAGETDSDTTPAGVAIEVAARLANGVLTGICIAASIALPVAVWATVEPGQPKSAAATLLALLFIVIFISRARAFSDRRQAVALVCGASVAFSVVAARYVMHANGTAATTLLWAGGVLIGFSAAGLFAALLVPTTSFTPLVRVAAEWLELVAIVAALPLAAWIGGLFTWVRMR
jgi:type VII secretion integral membrane protein EccD